MAVPKKRTSKTKTRTRKTIWKKKAEKQANKALSARLSKN
jgi:ribosomal protein L32